MSRIRIPDWVSAVWDLLERRPTVTWLAAGTVTSGVGALLWWPAPFLMFLLGYGALMTGLSVSHSRLAEMRADRDEHRADAIAKDQELQRLRRLLLHGNASASTLQISTIGERGEPT